MKKTLLIFIALTAIVFAQAQCTDLFISELVEGSGNNKALEIYNPTNNPIDLSGYQVVRYSNGGTTPNAVGLAGTIQPYDVYVIVLDKRDPNGTGLEQPVDSALMLLADTFLCPVYDVNKAMYFNGNDAMTLETLGGGSIIDIFARVGSPDPINGWTDITDTTITWNNGGTQEDYTIVNYIVGPLFWLSWTKDHTLIRKPEVQQGVVTNPAVFNVTLEWDSLPENTFDHLGYHVCDCDNSSLHELSNGANVGLFPNPVKSGNINIESNSKMSRITLINTVGQGIIVKELEGINNTYINIDELKSGLYFVKIEFIDNSYIIRKVIKE